MPFGKNPPEAANIAGILLAAGRSRRMGARNKLLCRSGDDPRPLVRIAAEAALAGGVSPLIVVLGHEADDVAAALQGIAHRPVRAPDHGLGLAHSLRAGLAALPDGCMHVMILLADMPRMRADTIASLIRATQGNGASAIVPSHAGRRGNPVVWHRRMFPALATLEGDQGARGLLREIGADVLMVETDDPGIHIDVDDEAALAALPNARDGRE